ncbi:hypothetical protein RND81_13G161700 [Saponaria officinalis]|uniref:KIB1-4 beta-propeller domain-containing protein n=1 Tax=Saponaria officinalis TaxID=3572 RepID=A0AAW1H0L8_SAPOF
MAPNPPWADLQPELLSNISTFLTSNPVDIFAFRNVCKAWNSACTTTPHRTLCPRLPFIVPFLPLSLSNQSDIPSARCILSVTVIYSRCPRVVDPRYESNIWMCFVDQVYSKEISIPRHISRPSYESYRSLPNGYPQTLDFSDFDGSELGRFYTLTAVFEDSTVKQYGVDVIKVVLSSNLSSAVALSREGKLAFIRHLQSNADWEIIHDGKGFHFDDIVEFKGVILGVDRRGGVYEISLGKPVRINVVVRPFGARDRRRKRLVVSLGELFLVLRCNLSELKDTENVAFKVYKLMLDQNVNKWVRVTEFGDRMFFFDSAFSFSASTQQLLGRCIKNCILFVQNNFPKYNPDDDDGDCYYYRGARYKPTSFEVQVWHLEDAGCIKDTNSYPSYCRLLWPFPTWKF